MSAAERLKMRRERYTNKKESSASKADVKSDERLSKDKK